MSVGKKIATAREQEGGGGEAVRKKEATSAPRTGYGRCFSGLEINVGPGPLRDVDAGKLKGQIMRWAKAVVAYARQLSFGSPRRPSGPRSRSSSTRPTRQGRGAGAGATATERAATFPPKSGGHGGAENSELEPAP